MCPETRHKRCGNAASLQPARLVRTGVRHGREPRFLSEASLKEEPARAPVLLP